MPDDPPHADTNPANDPNGTPDGRQRQHRPEIRVFSPGPYQTNCYVVSRPDPQPGDACWVVDCGFDPEAMIAKIKELGLQPEAVVLTHAHIDHIAGLFTFRSAFPEVPIWIHKAEEQWLSDPMLNLSAMSGAEVTGPAPARLLGHGDILTLAEEEWEVLHTPGHSPGGISLHHRRSPTVFVGDALFAGSIGRHDFPGSDYATLASSIREKLYTLPPETLALPGHGPPTQIGHEKLTNPYVREDGITV